MEANGAKSPTPRLQIETFTISRVSIEKIKMGVPSKTKIKIKLTIVIKKNFGEYSRGQSRTVAVSI